MNVRNKRENLATVDVQCATQGSAEEFVMSVGLGRESVKRIMMR